MRADIMNFIRSESGAVVTDWVVLAAATVGMGISSSGAVRNGVGNLGTGIQTALSNASAALICQGGSTSYSMLVLVGDRSTDAERANRQIASLSDDQLRANYEEAVVKVNAMHEGGDAQIYINEVMDYTYLYAQELENRRLTPPEGVQDFDALNAAITGAEASGSCGSSGGGSTSGGGDTGGGDTGGGEPHEYLTLTSDQVSEIEQKFREVDPRRLPDLISEVHSMYRSAAARNNARALAEAVDIMYVAIQTLAANGADREALANAEDMYATMVRDYSAQLERIEREGGDVDRFTPTR